MLRFATLFALCLTLVVATDSYGQRRARGRYYTPAPSQQYYYSQPTVKPVQQTVGAVTAAQIPAAAPAGVPCSPSAPVSAPTVGPTLAQGPGAPPPGDSPAPSAAPAGGKPWYACEGCKDPHCEGGGACKLYNPPVVTQTNDPHCHGDPKCEERHNPAEGKLPELPGQKIPFYKGCRDFEATVNVPHLIRNTQEFLKFGRQKYKVDCCEYEVCVVTCCCCVDSKYCDLKPFKAKLSVCYRQNGNVDIYVLDVPGMPKRWVLFLDAEIAAVKGQFANLPSL